MICCDMFTYYCNIYIGCVASFDAGYDVVSLLLKYCMALFIVVLCLVVVLLFDDCSILIT